jgi:hypothetical protein
MIGTILLSFLGGVVTVIYLEILGLQALLEPLRDMVAVLVPGG